MTRQRIGLGTRPLAYLVRALTLVLALAVFWYGLMVVLLAVKVSPNTVNSISAYRTLYHDAANLTAGDFTSTRRLIAGCAGVLVFLVFLYLALQELPRPYLTRGSFPLGDRDRGDTTVQPRAVERVVELAAVGSRQVTAAYGRLGDDHLDLHVHVRNAAPVADTLRDTHRRAVAALNEHGLPPLMVNVTLTGYDRPTTRELA